MTQLRERLHLDLADTLPGDPEDLPYLLEGPDPAIVQAETKPHHFLLASLNSERARFTASFSSIRVAASTGTSAV